MFTQTEFLSLINGRLELFLVELFLKLTKNIQNGKCNSTQQMSNAKGNKN